MGRSWAALGLCLLIPRMLAATLDSVPPGEAGGGCGGETVVYETGFERSDDFTPDTGLNGQNGWRATGWMQAWVMPGFLVGHGQSVYLGGPTSPGSSGTTIQPPIHFPDGGTLDPVRLKVHVAVTDPGDGAANDFEWNIMGSGEVLGTVAFSGGSVWRWAGGTNTYYQATGENYHQGWPADLIIEIHPGSGHWSAWWNSALVADRIPLGGTGKPRAISGFEVDRYVPDSANPGDGHLIFDRYRVVRRPAAPWLRDLPQSQQIVPGSGATLRVMAVGTPPLAYQWYRNGTRLPDATGPELLLRNQQWGDTGDYHVVVTNTFGMAASPPARISVVSPQRHRAWEFVRLAGQAGEAGSADGPGTTARFRYPADVAFAAVGHAYVADVENHTIRRVEPSGEVTTFAGTAGTAGHRDGPAASALFRSPSGVAVDADGNVVVADTGNHLIRRINSRDGSVVTLAGAVGTYGHADGVGSAASFGSPTGVAVDASGQVLVADFWNHAIRRVTPTGTVTTLAGTPGMPGFANGKGRGALFYLPHGIAVDRAGVAYVADSWNQCVRRVRPDGTVTTAAGTPGVAGFADGPAGCSLFSRPSRVAVAPDGRVVVTDELAGVVRAIDPVGQVVTLGGRPWGGGTVDGVGSSARFSSPQGVGIDGRGYLYVVDRVGCRLVAAIPPEANPPPPTLRLRRLVDRMELEFGDEEGSWLEVLEAQDQAGPWEVRWSAVLEEPVLRWTPGIPQTSGARFYRLRRR